MVFCVTTDNQNTELLSLLGVKDAIVTFPPYFLVCLCKGWAILGGESFYRKGRGSNGYKTSNDCVIHSVSRNYQLYREKNDLVKAKLSDCELRDDTLKG